MMWPPLLRSRRKSAGVAPLSESGGTWPGRAKPASGGMTRAAPRIKASPALPTADDPMALCSGKVESILNAGLTPPQEDQAKKSEILGRPERCPPPYPPATLCTSRLEGSLKRLFPVLVQQPLPELKCRLRPGFLPPVEPSRDRGLRDSEVAHKCRFPAPFGLAEGE